MYSILQSLTRVVTDNFSNVFCSFELLVLTAERNLAAINILGRKFLISSPFLIIPTLNFVEGLCDQKVRSFRKSLLLAKTSTLTTAISHEMPRNWLDRVPSVRMEFLHIRSVYVYFSMQRIEVSQDFSTCSNKDRLISTWTTAGG